MQETTLRVLQGATLTTRPGRPTLKSVSKTRNEISAAFAKAKTSHKDFPMGERFGYAAAVMKPRKFIRLHNAVCPTGQELADNWVFNHPERPDAYDSTIANNAGEANR